MDLKNLDWILMYPDKGIYDEDETRPFQLLSAKTLAAKANKCVGGNTSKKPHHSTDLLKHECFEHAAPVGYWQREETTGLFMPVAYVSNNKVWMTRDIFRKWLADFDKKMFKAKRKVLLLLDSCTVHHMNAHLRPVEVLLLSSNTTENQEIIVSLKVKGDACRGRRNRC